jgi:hypothetical protein
MIPLAGDAANIEENYLMEISGMHFTVALLSLYVFTVILPALFVYLYTDNTICRSWMKTAKELVYQALLQFKITIHVNVQ